MKRIRFFACLMAVAGLLSGCGAGTNSAETTAVPSETETLEIYCFSAGKADAFLIYNNAGAVLIDAGESGFGKVIVAKLAELGIDRLDALIITHFDKDHVGGAKKVLESVEVGTVLQSCYPKTGADAYEKYCKALETLGITPVTVRQIMTISLGDAILTINPPAQLVYSEDESNNSSLIVSIEHAGHRLLFLGDAGELRMAEYLASSPGSFDFVKLPHHGSYQSALAALLEQTTPSRAVITSSEEDPEDARTMALLEQAGTAVWLTRIAPVRIQSMEDELTVFYDIMYGTGT